MRHTPPPHPTIARHRRCASVLLAATLALLLPGLAWAQPTTAAAGQPKAPNPAQPSAVPALLSAQNVAVIPIRREIDQITAASVLRRIRVAEAAKADAIVIDLECPGGEIGAVLDITNAIKASTVPLTIGWVNREAYSGGAIVALACDRIVVADPSAFGDAFPIVMGFESIQAVPDELRPKVLPPLLGEVVDSARRQGYDEYLVQAIVQTGVELWLVRDRATGRTMCVDASEYALLFDGDPPRGSPMLPTGSRVARAAGQRQGTPAIPAQPTPTPDPAQPTSQTPAQATPAGEGELGFRPAFTPDSPGLREAVNLVNDRLTFRSTRPVITQADRGTYELVGYVTNGSGAIVLSPDDALRFGIALAVVRDESELKQTLGASSISRLDPEWTEQLAASVSVLNHPIIRAGLIAVFMIGLILELLAPGSVLPIVISITALLAAVLPAMLVGMAGWWELAAIGLGMVLIAFELIVLPGFGVAGVLGIIVLFIGLVGTFVSPGSGMLPNSPGQQSELVWGVVMVLLAMVTTGIVVSLVVRNSERLPVLNKLVLSQTVKSPIDDPKQSDPLLAAMRGEGEAGPKVGDEGVVVSPLRPFGRAAFGQRVVEVVASIGSADAGQRVRVLTIRGYRIEVEPVAGTTPDAPAAPTP